MLHTCGSPLCLEIPETSAMQSHTLCSSFSLGFCGGMPD